MTGGTDVRADERTETSACRILVTGVVQGVGFRPYVWRLANELALAGTVKNQAGQVEIEIEGPAESIEAFVRRLPVEAPPRARVESVVSEPIEPGGRTAFVIEESEAVASTERLFPPDIATCDDCLREIFDPADRRHRYPFTNCTNCGPRATIIEDLPYDRAKTSMRAFPLCSACEAEYRNPANRRFHAEPVACADCGPQLSYRRTDAAAAESHGEEALAAAVRDLRDGRIVAIKGLGGYHLACDATDSTAVARLRDRKHRWAKAFAVMVRDVDDARRYGRLTAAETDLLTSPARPIVLVDRRADADPPLVDGPREDPALNRRLGLFLPYTPLHHLLLRDLGRPIVLTSGNLSDEPLATDDADALERLAAIADSFLAHDREIRARYDDSVTRVVEGQESVIRRGRGYAPEPLTLPVATPATLLAVGAELKHTFTLARGSRAHVAPHTGDLEDLLTYRAFEGNLAHLKQLLDVEPEYVVHDLHPAYLSTQFAVREFAEERRIAVQHHHAHVASAAAEAGITGPFIGVAYDGLGMGDDDTFWGGEVLVATFASFRRVGRFAYAPMPGGALAVKKPYRMALGYLLGCEAGFETDGAARAGVDAFINRLDRREFDVVRTQVARGLNTPIASSAGRLYDAVASILGIRDVAEYEAQAAIELELLAEPGRHDGLDGTIFRRDDLLVYDPAPTIADIFGRLERGETPARLAARFQETVAQVTREFVRDIGRETGIEQVALSGGVFQNQWLASTVARRLRRDGFDVHLNRQVPANDGGISYGQAAIAAARLAER